MPPRYASLALALVCLAFAGCGDGHDTDDVQHGRLEVLIEANLGDGLPAVDAPLFAARLAVTAAGDVLLAGGPSVRRVDARTGTIETVPGTELETCADGSSVEGTCGVNVVAVAVDRPGRIWFATADRRIFRVGPEGGEREHVLGQTFDRCPDGLPVAGPADDVCFRSIADLAFDRAGNLVVADRVGARVLRFDPTTRSVTVVAGTGDGLSLECADDVPATETCIGFPEGIAIDPDGGVVIAAEGLPVRRVDPATGLITRVAGRTERCFDGDRRDGGPARDACLWSVTDVAVDEQGDLFVADVFDATIRRVDAATGTITTFAGPDPEQYDQSLAIDARGRVLVLGFTAGFGGQVVRRFEGEGPGSAVIAGNGDFGFCGDGGPAHDACLGTVTDVALGTDGTIYVADLASRRVRRIANGDIATIAGNGLPSPSGALCADGEALANCLEAPGDVAVDRAGSVYVLDGLNDVFAFNRVRRVDRAGRLATIIGGCRVEGDPTTVPAADACVHVAAIATAPHGTLWVAESTRLSRFDEGGGRLVPVVTGPPECDPFVDDPRPQCFHVRDLTVDGAGNVQFADGRRVWRLPAGGTAAAVVAGNGTLGDCGDGGAATDACLVAARVAADDAGNLFVAGSGLVRRVDAATGVITRVAGHLDGLCVRDAAGRLVPPDSDCATVHVVDAEGRLLYAEIARFAIGRVVRLTP